MDIQVAFSYFYVIKIKHDISSIKISLNSFNLLIKSLKSVRCYRKISRGSFLSRDFKEMMKLLDAN